MEFYESVFSTLDVGDVVTDNFLNYSLVCSSSYGFTLINLVDFSIGVTKPTMEELVEHLNRFSKIDKSAKYEVIKKDNIRFNFKR